MGFNKKNIRWPIFDSFHCLWLAYNIRKQNILTANACTLCRFFIAACSFQINLTSLSAIKKVFSRAKDFLLSGRQDYYMILEEWGIKENKPIRLLFFISSFKQAC